MLLRLVVSALAAAAFSVAPAGVHAASGEQPEPEYRLIVIDGFDEGHSAAFGLNDHGVAVGRGANGTQGWQAFIWEPGRGSRVLEARDGSSVATAINNNGDAVGYIQTNENGMEPLQWTRTGETIPLGARNGPAHAKAISDGGYITGVHYGNGGTRTAFLYQIDGPFSMETLTSMPEDCAVATAAAVNAHGVVAGAVHALATSKAAIWTGGQHQVIAAEHWLNSEATAINDEGVVAGWYETRPNHPQAFLWRPDSGVLEVEASGGSSVQLFSINDRGQGAGAEADSRNMRRAIVWDEERGSRDLNGLVELPGDGWRLTEARAINNRGWIAGTADVLGVSRAFVLQPIQETHERTTPPAVARAGSDAMPSAALAQGGIW